MQRTESRGALLFKNLFAYGSMQVLVKLVPLVMLPIVTSLLADTADFGRYDMFNTISDLVCGLALLGMGDAVFREYFERNNPLYQKAVTSTGITMVLAASLVAALLTACFSAPISQAFFGDNSGQRIVLLASFSILFQTNEALYMSFVRMDNRQGVYVATGVANSVFHYLFAILLLKRGYGYNSLIYAMLATLLPLTVFNFIINRKHFSLKAFDPSVAKELLRIGLPLVPVGAVYWAFHSMDKIMITRMLGLSELGIYSTGAKLAQIGQIIYLGFISGWQYFAFTTMRDDDQVELTSKIFEYLGALSLSAMFAVCMFDRWLFRLLFAGNYAMGYTVFPYLFLSPLLLMLFQTAGNQLLIVKKTLYSTLCLIAGLVVNLVLNYYGILYYGIRGAALATLMGYGVSLVLILLATKRLGLLTVRPRFVLLAALCVGFTALRFLTDSVLVLPVAGICLLMGFLLYRKDLAALMRSLLDRIKK